LRLIVILFGWRIEPKALCPLTLELELQPPHILIRIKRLATGGSQKFGIPLVAFLLRLQRLVGEARHHLTPPELDTRRCTALEVERAFEGSGPDKAAKILREVGERWRIACQSMWMSAREIFAAPKEMASLAAPNWSA